MQTIRPSLRQVTAAFSVALILIGAVISGHARAAHINGLTSAGAPCHHDMSDGTTATDNTALDLCRELCLNKVPDTAITAATVQPGMTSVLDAQPAYIVFASPALTPTAAGRVITTDHRPRPALTPATPRLLI